MIHFTNSARLRRSALQAGFVGVIALVIASAIFTARQNLVEQGLTSGFGFLSRATGWDISFSLLSFQPNDTYARALLIGLTNTLFLTALTLPLATVIGVIVALLRTSGLAVLEKIGTVYVELFRNVPILLQLLFWYSLLRGLPQPRDATGLWDMVYLTGRGLYTPALSVAPLNVSATACLVFVAIGIAVAMRLNRHFRALPHGTRLACMALLWLTSLCAAALILWAGRDLDQPFVALPEAKGLGIRGGARISPELAAMILAIAIYGGAYIAEIMRAGFNSVPKGQYEAGKALGISSFRIFTRIRFPLALRAVLPTLANQYIWLTKASTLGIAVGFADYFMVVSTAINQSGQTLELIGLLAAGFLAVNYTLGWVMNRTNDAIKLRGTQWRG